MERLKNYIGGRWIESKAEEFLTVKNPGTGETIAEVPLSTHEDVDAAVGEARKAFEEWSSVPLPERVSMLVKLRNLMTEKFEDLARLITIEHGKTLEESKGDMRRTLENIDAAIGALSLAQGSFLQEVARGIDERMMRVPVGVFAIITPFNFPILIPFWFLPYALACGNTVVIKPSEQVPKCMNEAMKLFEEAGLPKGVVNIVHGDKGAVDALLEHPEVKGVTSVTSTPVAKYIYAKAASQGKRVLCQGGAKNFLVVMPDADMERTVPSILTSVFGNAGQRCLAGSNVVAVGGIGDELVKLLVEEASKIRVGYGLDEGVDMGPVISEEAKRRIEGYIEKGVEEGAKLLLDGRNVKVDKYPNGYYLGPTILDHVRPDMVVAREEIFGPVMTVIRAESLDEAIDMINSNPFGNAAVIYASNGKVAREFAQRVECGNIGVNIGLPAPMAFFPFCGMKDSFFGDLHGQSPDAFEFFTHKKVIIERWW